MQIDEFNSLDMTAAEALLLTCCSSARWAQAVARLRPFSSAEDLLQRAEDIWHTMGEVDFLSAFSGHPKIGDMNALRNKYASAAYNTAPNSRASTTQAEQGQVANADETLLLRLQQLNCDYENKFGFIFIVCATGKSADEMLALLEQRINNKRKEELAKGAAEQAKITRLRLEKLFASNIPATITLNKKIEG